MCCKWLSLDIWPVNLNSEFYPLIRLCLMLSIWQNYYFCVRKAITTKYFYHLKLSTILSIFKMSAWIYGVAILVCENKIKRKNHSKRNLNQIWKFRWNVHENFLLFQCTSEQRKVILTVLSISTAIIGSWMRCKNSKQDFNIQLF